jgi:hypothetical protein
MRRRELEGTSQGESMERRKILVVGKEGIFTEEIIVYVLHLAERLDYDILTLSVDTAHGGEEFRKKTLRSANVLRKRAAEKGISCRHAMKLGDLGAAVEEINHEVKRIEFVVTDSAVNRDEVAREVTVPMFSVVSNSLSDQGGKIMADDHGNQKGKPVVQTIGYGILTAGLYAAVFLNSDTVMQYFTKGGLYAALPIATVFVFSFAHGAFASNLWSLLGIEAMKKGALRQTEQKVVQKKKQAQKRPRAYAYVNPFHRIDK